MTQSRILQEPTTTRVDWPVSWRLRGLWLAANVAEPFDSVFFGMEETTRGGSRSHVARIISRSNERLAGVLIFEMIGYRTYESNSQRTPVRIPLILWPPRTGDFITLVSDFRSSSIATSYQKAARKYVPTLRVFLVKRIGRLLKDGIRSDHSMYWQLAERE